MQAPLDPVQGPPASVLVVDDHPLLRRAIVALLRDEDWVGEVYEAESAEDALQEAVIRSVDLIVMDVHLGGANGIDATRSILKACPSAKILILTMDEYPDTVTAALRSGAYGYVSKRSDPGDIVDALHTVSRGGFVLGPAVGQEALRALREQTPPIPPPFDQLTERERAILALFAQSRSNAYIARQLGVSEKTVRNQATTIYSKLGVSDRIQAALLARDAGLVPPPLT